MGVMRRPRAGAPSQHPPVDLSKALSPANERQINELQEIQISCDLSPLPPHNFHFLLSRTRQGPFLDQPFEIPGGNPVKSDLSSNTRKPPQFFSFCFKIPCFYWAPNAELSLIFIFLPFLFPSPFLATESGREPPGGGGIFHPFW